MNTHRNHVHEVIIREGLQHVANRHFDESQGESRYASTPAVEEIFDNMNHKTADLFYRRYMVFTRQQMPERSMLLPDMNTISVIVRKKNQERKKKKNHE